MRYCPASTNMMSTLATAVFVLFLAHGSLGETIINVDVYYEVLCGDSVRFIKNQLVPSYPNLREHLNVNFVPYGKAQHDYDKETDEYTFQCQHGRAECNGNKAQACALDAIEINENPEDRQRLSVKFVGCVMSSHSPDTSGPDCAQTAGLKAETIRKTNECVQSKLGGKLLAALGNRTHALQPRLAFVPTVILNGVYSSENQSGAIRNFKKLICDQIPQDEKPIYCAE